MKGPGTGPLENHTYARWFTYSTIALMITIAGGTILKSKLTMKGVLDFSRFAANTFELAFAVVVSVVARYL
ncbi:hypothetical protein AB2B46_24005 (plasmid) [Kluyvera intermedia]|uniref:hypothetical protein n=1 Tax=Kluyvera intermedia TaxID=61648 RepID=UPI0034A43E05